MFHVEHHPVKRILLLLTHHGLLLPRVRNNPHYLSNALTEVMQEHRLSARALAKELGVAHSTFSRLKESRLDAKSLRLVIQHFRDPEEQQRLIIAHLWDEIVRAGANPDSVWKAATSGDMGWFLALPPGLQGNLQMLGYGAQTNPAIAILLDGLAEKFGRAAAASDDQLTLRAAEDATSPMDGKTKPPTPAEGEKRTIYPVSRKKRSA